MRKTIKTFSGFKRGRKNLRGSSGSRRLGPRQRLIGRRYRGFDRRAHGWLGAAPVLFYYLVRLRSGIRLLGPVLLWNEPRSLWHELPFTLKARHSACSPPFARRARCPTDQQLNAIGRERFAWIFVFKVGSTAAESRRWTLKGGSTPSPSKRPRITPGPFRCGDVTALSRKTAAPG